MHRRAPLIAAFLCAAVVTIQPASTAGRTGSLSEHYRATYALVTTKEAGPYAGGLAGRNLAIEGVRTPRGERGATDVELRDGIAVMGRMLNPPPSVQQPPLESVVCSGVTPYAGGGRCWAIPYEIIVCESGGDFSAYNPSGASGAYQLMIGGQGTPAEQDAAAAELWAGGAGRSNWVC